MYKDSTPKTPPCLAGYRQAKAVELQQRSSSVVTQQTTVSSVPSHPSTTGVSRRFLKYIEITKLTWQLLSVFNIFFKKTLLHGVIWGNSYKYCSLSWTLYIYIFQQRTVRALYDYIAADSDEVTFKDGDVIVNVQSIDEGWMYGTVQRTGKTGMLPANYVEAS